MDYSKLSDFEINRRVFESKTGLQTLGYPHNYDKRSCGHKDINGNYQWFAPCNNAADAWPIIVENSISLILDNPSSAMATSNCVGWYSDEDPTIHASNQNPLRAAMTVFLMMQESANVQDGV
ncbi:DUF2591 family protein [Salmonella enterica subsp. enterica serovar Johannesburg]|nr:DUF2591 family protein [Salmonella enterica subsp. enterica serovar Johannesburg]